MEGVAGITRWQQVTGGDPMYETGQRLYTEEINAAVRGAFDGGATEVVVMDCHGAGKDWSFNSLVPDMLDERCEFVVQNSWTEYTKVLEDGCDAALFVAMHALAGTPDGTLSHTVSSTRWRNLRFNGTVVGETGINAALCGTWGTPVLMVTGDRATCAEAQKLLGQELITVAVKDAFGRYSARHVAPLKARKLIEEAAHRAVSQPPRVSPYDPGKPCEIQVDLADAEDAAAYRNRPGIRIQDSRTISCTADDWWSAWKQVYL
jgi:D-amino peptidase